MSDDPRAGPETLGEFYRSGVTAAVAPATHEKLRLAEAYAIVFDSPAGVIVWRDLMHATGALDSPYSADDRKSAVLVRLGRHEIGLHLLNRRRWAQQQFGLFDEPTDFATIAEQERYAAGTDDHQPGEVL